MADHTASEEWDEEQEGTTSRGSVLLVALLGVSALFGVFYFSSTYAYIQGSAPKKGSRGKHLRVALADLRFDRGVAGPISYDTNEGVYLTRTGDTWLALEQTCPHQGCPVDWHGGDARFVCPCHGSAYDRLGNVVQGPSARGLYRHQVAVQRDALVIEGRL